jgi:hypothetical protein
MAFVNSNRVKIPTLSVMIAALMATMSGCVKEDLSNCPPTPDDIEEVLVVRAIDFVSGADITHSGTVTGASLFVFDQNERFITQVDVPADQLGNELEIPISVLTRATAGDAIHISAWGNLEDNVDLTDQLDPNNDDVIDAGVTGVTLDHTLIDLEPDEDKSSAYMDCPGNTFFGFKSIVLGQSDTRATQKIIHRVEVKQKSSRLHITVRGLPATARSNDYYFTLRRQNDGYTFEGTPVSDDSRAIWEVGEFNAIHDFVSPQPYYLVPSVDPENVTASSASAIRLFQVASQPGGTDTDLTGPVTQDIAGEYIALFPGQTTNVYIEFSPSKEIEVRMVVTPWDEVYQWSKW